MTLVSEARATRFGVGTVTVAAVGAWSAYAVIGGIEPNGRHFLELAGMRLVLFAALLAFGLSLAGRVPRVLTLGLVLSGLGAAAYLVGAVGAVGTDGWSFDPLADPSAEPPWYLMVIGLSANVFSLGAILVGIAGRAAGWPAAAVALGGALYPLLLFPIQPFGVTIGHLLWLLPWLALGVWMSRTGSRQATVGTAETTARHP